MDGFIGNLVFRSHRLNTIFINSCEEGDKGAVQLLQKYLKGGCHGKTGKENYDCGWTGVSGQKEME